MVNAALAAANTAHHSTQHFALPNMYCCRAAGLDISTGGSVPEAPGGAQGRRKPEMSGALRPQHVRGRKEQSRAPAPQPVTAQHTPSDARAARASPVAVFDAGAPQPVVFGWQRRSASFLTHEKPACSVHRHLFVLSHCHCCTCMDAALS